MNKQEIGAFILNERKNQKLSQKALAEKAGIGRWQQVLEIEKAQFNYSVDSLLKVANALGLNIVVLSNNHVEVKDGWKSIPDEFGPNPYFESKTEVTPDNARPDVIIQIMPKPYKSSGTFDFSKIESAKEPDEKPITKQKKVITDFKRKK